MLEHLGKRRQKYSYVKKIPKQIDDLKHLVSDVNNSSMDQLRMSKDALGRLCILFRDYAGLLDSQYLSLTENVCIFLGILAHHRKIRLQIHKFRRSTWTISHHFQSVMRGVLALHDKLLVKPIPLMAANALEKFEYFENCLGALDGSYFPARVRAVELARHRNRKGGIAFNLLGVVEQNMNFIYMLVDFEGSTSDSLVLKDAITRTNMKLCVPRGVGCWNQALQNAKEYFNMRHSSARNVIERAWGILKKCRGILHSESFYPLATQSDIILGCPLLHNFSRSQTSEDPMELLVLVPEDYHEEDAADLISSLESTPAWATKRDEIAETIWNDFRNG